MANNTKRTLYLVFIFILLLTNIVAGYFWLNSNEKNDVLTEEKSVLETDYMSLQQDMETQVAKLNAMKGENEELDKVIAEREAEIAEQQKKITLLFKQKNFTASELNKAKAMISSLEIQNAGFMTKIDSLHGITEQLKQDKVVLENDLSAEKDYNQQLQDQNKFLDEKFELGSLLRADELKASGIKVKNNGVEKEVDRIKRIEKIKVCFQTGNNLVRESGSTTMYLRLISPTGTTFFNEGNGSGTFSNVAGEELRYSKKAEFDFDGKNKNICIYWTQELNETGTYKALVYQDGYMVGETSLELK